MFLSRRPESNQRPSDHYILLLQSDALPIELQREITLPDGFEPPTYRLTADRSTS